MWQMIHTYIHTYIHCTRGAVHSLEKAYEISLEQRDLFGFLMDFSSKKGILAKGVRGFWE